MLFDQYYQEIFDQLSAAVTVAIKENGGSDKIDLNLEIPPDQKLGDFAFPTFKLAKVFRKAPKDIAQDLLEKVKANPSIDKKFNLTTVGPYLNFSVKQETLVTETLKDLLCDEDQIAKTTKDGNPNVILEFSSPNVAKPFNIYHLRTTMLGNSLYRIFKARGYNPIAINHLGDWGTQFGAMVLGFEKWGDEKELEKRGIPYLVELYVKINKAMEADEALAKKAREYFSKLENHDPKIQKYWKKFVDLSIKEFKRTYERLNVHFDHYWGESFYIDKIPALEKALKDKKLLVESDGAQVVDLEKFEMPPCLIRKQDGSTLYATRDLAAAIYRHEKYNFERMIYVVGGEQSLHFKQVFKVLELMNHKWAERCEHVPTGLYRFVDSKGSASKMSTRKGKFVTMEAVLDEAVERVLQIMEQKGTELNQEDRKTAAEIIGVGAVVYNDLSTDRSHDVNFDLERVVDFEGETGPYVQYAHTRCLSILRNAPKNLTGKADDLLKAAVNLKEVEELGLIRTLAKLPIVLDQVIQTSRPSHLAHFLIEITKSFNAFYRSQKVLVDDEKIAKARLALVLATQRTLHRSMSLLGMATPERM